MLSWTMHHGVFYEFFANLPLYLAKANFSKVLAFFFSSLTPEFLLLERGVRF